MRITSPVFAGAGPSGTLTTNVTPTSSIVRPCGLMSAISHSISFCVAEHRVHLDDPIRLVVADDDVASPQHDGGREVGCQ